jgi:sulfide:quinone oxidoreductase
MLVTPEEAPLAVFGAPVSEAVRELLELRGIRVYANTTAVAVEPGLLHAEPLATLEADRVVALTGIDGPRLPGLPADRYGFVPTDRYGRVHGVADVYAAGDATAFPLKHGGLAAQQADAAASAIAASAGAPVTPTPYAPVLRGVLLTGTVSRYLRADTVDGASAADTQPLWWPPTKIVGRHLSPFLARRLGLVDEPPSAGPDVHDVEVELDRERDEPWVPL